jgi:hypothetical protein
MFYAAAIRANRVGADSPWMTRRGAPLVEQGGSAAEDEHGEKSVELRSSVCRIGGWGSFLASPDSSETHDEVPSMPTSKNGGGGLGRRVTEE